MGRRTLTATEMTFHKKFARTDAETFAPSDLMGEDLLDIFQQWVARLTTQDTRDSERQNWVQVMSVTRHAPRVLVLVLSVGSYGEPGPIVETGTGMTVFEMTDDQAPTGENRAVLMVPATGESAFLLAEESSRGSAGGRILRLFKHYFSKYTSQITMVTETVTESSAWADAANLVEVEVRIKGRGKDIADGPHIEVGTLSHIARPRRLGWFPRDLLGSLRRDRSVAGQVVGIVDPPEDADVYVTLQRDGRKKKFALGNTGAPAIREVLNDAIDPPLSVHDLVNVCAEKVSDLAARTGGTWDSRWSNPQGG